MSMGWRDGLDRSSASLCAEACKRSPDGGHCGYVVSALADLQVRAPTRSRMALSVAERCEREIADVEGRTPISISARKGGAHVDGGRTRVELGGERGGREPEGSGSVLESRAFALR